MAESRKLSIVERRMQYIERQRLLKPEAVDVRFNGREPQGTGEPNRHGMPGLPGGQHEVKNWPVLDLGVTPDIALQEWKLTLEGEVENPVTLSWDDFMALPQVADVSDFHCVTTWSRMNNRWRGVQFKALAELAIPRESARYVLTIGFDHQPTEGIPYTTNLPLARAVEDDVLLVHTWEDQPLPKEHGGPVRMITPKLYAWKGCKWIRRIQFLKHDQKGFWEQRGYSNSAEPWFEDRFQQLMSGLGQFTFGADPISSCK